MIKHSDILQLCRLCLVEEKVNHSIFEESGDLRGILLKITSCLPVSISQDDSLPKRICETCFTKLDSYYKFWNDSANAEKQLLQWLSQTTLGTISNTGQGDINKSRMEKAEVKEESIDLEDGKLDSLEMSTDAKTYILQQQQLPYSVATPKILPSKTNETDEPASKRPRRASAMKALEHMESEDEDDDLDDGADVYAKAETDDSDKEDENYQEGPSTSMDDQPGPSGVGKGTTETSYYNEMDIKDEFMDLEIKIEDESGKEDDDNEKKDDENEKEDDGNEKEDKENYEFYDEIAIKEEFIKHELEDEQILITFDTDMDSKNSDQIKSKDTPGLCHLCGRILKRIESHIRSHGEYKCKDCLDVFKKPLFLEKHMKRHEKTPYQCDNCSLYYPTALELSKHSRKHFKEYKCPYCDFMTLNFRMLPVHLGSHDVKHNFICETCGFCFFTKIALQRHEETHRGIKKYACKFCSKKFTIDSYMKTHMRFKHSFELTGVEEIHTCQVCSRTFSFEKSLVRHLSNIHNIGKSRKVKCPVCSKIMADNFSLKIHMTVHTGEMKHICETCGKRCRTTEALRRHLKVHSKLKDTSGMKEN